ncbi:MAG: AGE family epimerase/isomerase [Anaerolinea sp.]|nr:AGE family epimerase/isomerase [Anaerolinea sp.]
MILHTPTDTLITYKAQLTAELTENILPFWMTHTVDRVHGGFYGAVTNDLHIDNEAPRTAVLCARVLWTYAAAYRHFGHAPYLQMAQWAYAYLTQTFLDAQHGGLYWSVNRQGAPVMDRKHHYAQAFGIYGLTEYYRATQEPQSLALAQELFWLLEQHAADPLYGGYSESSGRQWQPIADMRLSDKDLNSYKSMNTMLHILEAYTNLLRVWKNPHLRRQHRALITAFLQQIIDLDSHHCQLFFDRQWRSLSVNISYGHDIEASWLLWEAAALHDDARLQAQVRETAVKMATAVYQEALDDDGSLFYEGSPQGLVDMGKAWWVQAEAVVGFYNAYQLSGQPHFAQAAWRCWEYIQANLVDRTHGDWYKHLHRDGAPDHAVYKAGPWECPYHHSRACLEMLTRLQQTA